ncbi:MAG TPA: hypothetical protein VGQ72_11520 [Pyrinomonadaceae bacterium]|jgi:hypothetical protein|nr:hypothetical protein [Pyrinomonadaceae bacterium]
MVKRISLIAIIVCFFAVFVVAQQTESRVALNQPAVAADTHGTAAIEARLSTQTLNGADDSPVMNVKLVVKNVSSTFYTYVSGWATFYDSAGVRCGEGLFKLDALAVDESAAADTPGLRVRCSPATWRIVATNLLTRTADVAKPGETATPASEGERPTLSNFLISIDGEEHPIQLNNPITLQMGNRERRIVLRSAP